MSFSLTDKPPTAAVRLDAAPPGDGVEHKRAAVAAAGEVAPAGGAAGHLYRIVHRCENCDYRLHLQLSVEGAAVAAPPKPTGKRAHRVKEARPVKPPKRSRAAAGSPSPLPAEARYANLPAVAKVAHLGWWVTVEGKHLATRNEALARNSVVLAPTSLLYVWKLALRHLCLARGWVSPARIDAQNLVPHIRVREDKSSASSYDAIEGEEFCITPELLSAKSDFLTLELDAERGLHCTMIFAKGLKKRADMIAAFDQTLGLLNARPELIAAYASLPYFGQAAIHYWHDTPELYPDNIVPPAGYVPVVRPKLMPVGARSAAGTVLVPEGRQALHRLPQP